MTVVGLDPGLDPTDVWWQFWSERASCLGSHRLGRLATRQGFVVTCAQAELLGLTRSAQRARVHRGAWLPAGRGVLAPVALPPADEHLNGRRRHALCAAGAALGRPGQVITGRSAAVLHALPTLVTPVSAELTAARRHGLGTQSHHVYGAALSPRETTRWFGAPVTDIGRTLVDLARHDRRDGIVAADAALRSDLLDRSDIDRALARARGWPGVARARTVLGLADRRAESPLESLVRLAVFDSGLPAPQLQQWIGGYRVDLCWPEVRLIVEADGRSKYTGDALWREKRREDALRRLGWRIERIVWADLFAGWPAIEHRLLSHFRRA